VCVYSKSKTLDPLHGASPIFLETIATRVPIATTHAFMFCANFIICVSVKWNARGGGSWTREQEGGSHTVRAEAACGA